MTGTVETDLSFFSGETGGSTDCDSETDWTGQYGLDTVMMVQGSGCLTIKASKTTARAFFDISGTVDLTNKLLFFWAMFADPLGKLANKSAGGLGIRIESSDTDYVEWYVAGKDMWGGEWKPFAVHVDQTPDESGGSVNKAAVNRVAIRFTTVETAKVTPNCYFDAIRYGTFLRNKGGTEASPGVFEDFIIAEENTSNKYGLLRKEEGVILAQGNLVFGSTISGESTYFKDTSKQLVFTDRPFGEFYNIKLEGNESGTTSVYFGDISGDRGISGCIFNSAGASKYKIDATNTLVTNFGFRGCTYLNANTISLQPADVGKDVLSCNFEECAEVLPDTSTIKFSNFVGSPGRAIRISNLNHNISDCNFISCSIGVHVSVPGTLTFTNMYFSGNTYDIENSTTGTVIVNCVDSNPSSAKLYNPGGGSIELILSAIHKLTGMVENTEVTYVQSGTTIDVFHVENVPSSGITEYSYDASVESTVDIYIHHIEYVPIKITNVVLGTEGGEIPITQYKDRVYENP